MFAYFAMAWDSKDQHAVAFAAELRQRAAQRLRQMKVCYAVEGLQVWCSLESAAYHVYPTRTDGVLVGTLFNNDSTHVSAETFEKSYIRLMGNVDSSTVGCLCSAFWGRFVGFSRDAVTGAAFVFRDPSGFINCLRTSWNGVHVFCSDIADCKDVGFSFSVDWEFVAAHISSWKATGKHTSLKEVKYLPPGGYVVLEKGELREGTFWDPLQLASNSLCDEREAEELIYSSVTGSVRAWAGLYGRVVVQSSGGFDSSVVAGCVRETSPDVDLHTLNFYSAGALSDEREYAEEMARFLRCELIKLERPRYVEFAQALEFRPSVRLDFNALSFETASLQSEVARRVGAAVVLSGSGGDQLFGSRLNDLSTADLARRRPFGRSLFKLCKQAALLERMSMWEVLRKAYMHGPLRQPIDPHSKTRLPNALLTEKTMEFARRRELEYHPWRAGETALPPGKLVHVGALVNRLTGDSLGPGAIETVDPLMSTRAIEAGFRIPTYFLFRDGWDRGLARKAFGRLIPETIAQRTSKGGVMEYMLDIVSANLPFAGSMLLGGVLAQRGFIDEKQVKHVLAQGGASSTSLLGMLQVLFAEMRLRSWVSR
jgi:asparagine synthase (glutamine-hydrolysing)